MAWALDKSRGVWIAATYRDLNSVSINNLAEYGEPASPYEPAEWVEDFQPDFSKVTVEMSQQEVMSHGYGKNITAYDFPIVKRFLFLQPTIPFGTYSFPDLVKLKYASPSERFISTNLYGWGPYAISAGDLDAPDAAYVHGSVSFALMVPKVGQKGSQFINAPDCRRVEAEIGAGNDNWDFNSATIPTIVNSTVAVLMGPDHYNLEKPISIKFTGPGKYSVVEHRVLTLPGIAKGISNILGAHHK